MSRKVWAIQDARAMDKDQNGLGVSEEEVAYTLDGTGAQGICESAPFSQESEDSTSDSTEQGCDTPSSAKATPTEDESSSDIGRESPSMRTYEVWENNLDGKIYCSEDETPPLKSICDRLWLTSSAGASPVKTSPSPAEDEDSRESAQGCSSSSPESLTLWSDPEGGSSLRTYPDFFHPTVDEISPSFSRRWPSSGFVTSPGECWTADTSECPSDGDGSSSLRDVLVADVPARFYLSPKAAAGILRRAEKRGKPLPEALRTALTQLAASRPHSDGTERQRTSSPTPSKPQPEAPSREPTTTPTSVRRLSPTECERLQSLPDGWTIPQGPSLAPSPDATGKEPTPRRTTEPSSLRSSADPPEASPHHSPQGSTPTDISPQRQDEAT